MRIARALEALGKNMASPGNSLGSMTAEQWASAAGSFFVVGLASGMVVGVMGAPTRVSISAALIGGAVAGRIAAKTSRRG